MALNGSSSSCGADMLLQVVMCGSSSSGSKPSVMLPLLLLCGCRSLVRNAG
jgi:hypothetical protein